MDRLNQIIQEYGRWSLLSDYCNRIDTYINTDFSIAIENAKSLLESICKEICKEKNVALEANANINRVVRTAFTAIVYQGTEPVTQISSALVTIGQQIGNLRNDVGATSHGKTLEELEKRNEKINEITRELLIDTTEIIAVFLIKTFETENPRINIEEKNKKLSLGDNPEFNDYWDEIFGDVTFGNYSYPASEVLFSVDLTAYLAELKAFIEGEI